MPRLLPSLLILCLRGYCADLPAPLSAEDIMKKVAESQDRGQKERVNFIYEQSVRVASRHTGGKLAREEFAEILVIPTATGVEKKQQSIHGRYLEKGHFIEFSGDPVPKSDSLDGGLTAGFREDLTNDGSKDGMGRELFPLTTEAQKNMVFERLPDETVAGRKAYRIRFSPVKKDDIGWAGEALVDEDELQPISVHTKLSRKLPLFVRTLLGTDVPGLGFNAQYARIDKDVWFPVSFGTEFKLHAVFFINRTITVSMQSKNFRRATSDSQITFDDKPVQ